ncbi:MAG TPA: VOC family protein [Lacunisphaera sp.]|nr:VOC family protein [Lacunisphaera sp.]
MKILGTDFVTYYVGNFHAAVMFYRDILALPLTTYSDADQWAEFDCGNVTLALKGGEDIIPGDHAPRIALAVDDVGAAWKELKTHGVNIVCPPQDHGVCRHLELLDPDGNVVILHHRADGTHGQDVSVA